MPSEYQDIIKDLGFTTLMVGIHSELKSTLFPALSEETKDKLISMVNSSIKVALKESLANLQKSEESHFLATWELIEPFDQVNLAMEVIPRIEASFKGITGEFPGLPNITYRIAIATTCIMETGPNAGGFGAQETFHHVKTLFDLSNNSPHKVLLSSETRKYLRDKNLAYETLSPLMRLGIKEPLPVYAVSPSDFPITKSSSSSGFLSKIGNLFQKSLKK